MKKKVFIYITRSLTSNIQLLVFKHQDYPDAGIQIPGGTVEDLEDIQLAICRETIEESGLSVKSPRLIGDCKYFNEIKSEYHHRYFFHFHFETEISNHWIHKVKGSGEDKDLIFSYFWLDIKKASEVLEIDQGEMIEYCL